jgi:hypothetical protein
MYYRYLNYLFRMTLLPKGGNQMNVLGESRVLIYFMKPSKKEMINVFDLIWEEIVHAAWTQYKGCVHAPFIMKMIEVVTQTWFEKDCKHTLYTLYWIDPNNPVGHSKMATSGSTGSHLFLALSPVLLPLLVLWTTVGEEHDVEECLVLGCVWPMILLECFLSATAM